MSLNLPPLVCPGCSGSNVYTRTWANVNDPLDTVDYDCVDQTMCMDCCMNVTPIRANGVSVGAEVPDC